VIGAGLVSSSEDVVNSNVYLFSATSIVNSKQLNSKQNCQRNLH
jgi:hypothetical protein